MRLINTATYELEEYFEKDPPPYAILSHRWGRDEVSYQRYCAELDKVGPEFDKVLGFCTFARNQQPPYEYVWVDTCCIDKKSSAELSEAINSMWSWYEDAQACFVYLEDLPCELGNNKVERDAAFKESVWFRRGWTLQELLAPRKVVVCDRGWDEYGDKILLADRISEITGISKPFLNGKLDIDDASIAMRLSWAAHRETTKPEDQAYWLLGLLDVNMPLLYGEKQRAFLRLQLEIVKNSDDESIFAWTYPSRRFFIPDLFLPLRCLNERTNFGRDPPWGMLAPSPGCFAQCGSMMRFPYIQMERTPYEMTNKGLRFRGTSTTSDSREPNRALRELRPSECRFLSLGCFRRNPTAKHSWYPGLVDPRLYEPIRIELKRFGPVWQRINCHRLFEGNIGAASIPEEGYALERRGEQQDFMVRQPGMGKSLDYSPFKTNVR